jgi:hypothetical protein
MVTWRSEANKQSAEMGQCCECNAILYRGMLMQWTLRKTFWLHECGTGHKKFKVVKHTEDYGGIS